MTLFAAQVQELEGQICNHLEKIGSNLAKRHVQLPSPATDVRKRSSANETPDNSLVLMTGIAAAAAMTVLGLAILNKKWVVWETPHHHAFLWVIHDIKKFTVFRKYVVYPMLLLWTCIASCNFSFVFFLYPCELQEQKIMQNRNLSENINLAKLSTVYTFEKLLCGLFHMDHPGIETHLLVI